MLEVILSHWSSLSPWWGPSSTVDTQSMALALLTKLLLIDSKVIMYANKAKVEYRYFIFSDYDNATLLRPSIFSPKQMKINVITSTKFTQSLLMSSHEKLVVTFIPVL